MESSSWKAGDDSLASVSDLVLVGTRYYLNWIVVIPDFSHWSVKFDQSLDILSLALLVEDFLDLCQEAFTHSAHSFSESEPVNVGSLKPDIKFDIGKRLSSIGKQLKDAELIRPTALKRGSLFAEQVRQELILDLLFNVVQGRHLVIFLIKFIQLFQLTLRYTLILLFMAQFFIGLAQMLKGLDQFHDLRLVPLVVVAQFRNLVIEFQALGESMSACVILRGEIESEFFDIMKHVGVIFTDPSGAAFNREVLHLLEPLIAIRTLLQAFSQGQRANPAAEPL